MTKTPATIVALLTPKRTQLAMCNGRDAGTLYDLVQCACGGKRES